MDLPKTQEELAKLISSAVDDQVKGLKNKNSELLSSLTETKSTLKKFEGIDLDAISAQQKELQELKDGQAKEKGEYKKLYEQASKQHAEEIGKLQEAISVKDKNLANLTKKTAVVSALQGLNVIPDLMDVAVKNIMSEAAVDDDGNVKVGDKSVSEFAAKWAESGIGKHFIADGNSGGGANGGEGSGDAEQAGWFKKDSPTYNLTKQAELAKQNPELASRLRKQNGLTN